MKKSSKQRRAVVLFSGQTLRGLGVVLSGNRGLLIMLGGFMLATGVIPAAVAYIGKLVIDGVVALSSDGRPTGAEQVLFLVGIEACLIVMLIGSQRGTTTVQALLKVMLSHDVTRLIMTKALSLSLPQLEDPEIHDRMMQARREAASRPVSIVTSSFALIKDLVSLACFSVLLVQLSPWAMVLLVVAGLPGFIVEARFSGEAFRFLCSKTPEMRERNYYENIVIREDFAKELKTFRLGPLLRARYDELFEDLFRADRGIQIRRGLWGFALGACSSIFLYCAIFWVVLEAMAGRITIGAMTMYLVLFRQGQNAVSGALTSIGSLYENGLFLSNLSAFLAIPVSTPSGGYRVGLDSDDGLRFEEVCFTYPGSKSPALDRVSFHLRPGHQLALVGDNGSGKTTLVKLLCRLYSPDSGRIFLHGRDLEEWDIDVLHSRLAIIFQDFLRYKLTAGENIGVGDVEHVEDQARWVKAAELGLATDVVESLPNGYDTRLGKAFKGGYELSGGQWQKMALARLFMRPDADLFVLDEPTAAVDAESEVRIFDHVRAVTRGRMTILISHRLSAPRVSDQIIVLSHGRIIEQGRHEELMELGGRYAELFELQARGYQA